MAAELEGTQHKARNVLNLKDPFYRCSEYAGTAAQSAGLMPTNEVVPNGTMETAEEMEYEDAE